MTLERHDAPLRREMVQLGEILGRVIAAIAGEENLHLTETIRRLSRDFRQGLSDRSENERLQDLLASLNYDQLRIVIRAFTTFLDLANMVEDRQRVRVLRQRAAQSYPDAPSESIQAAIYALKAGGKTARETQPLIDRLRLELVFTAHPTEAKRRSIRSKLRTVRGLLEQLDSNVLTPVTKQRIEEKIHSELMKLWLTDFVRPWRPTVLQEVQRGLSIKPNLWRVAPQIMDELRAGLANVFPNERFRVTPCIRFGSWIGGDRDGHPFVTAKVTEQTLIWLRQAAIDLHRQTCHLLRDSLSISKRQAVMSEVLEEHIREAGAKWPELESELAEIPPNELCRLWLLVVDWRLTQTQTESLYDEPKRGAYSALEELKADVGLLHSTLLSLDSGKQLAGETSEWLDRIEIFGFHLAQLDVRQDSRTYKSVIDELVENAGLAKSGSSLSELDRQQLLAETMRSPLDVRVDTLSDTVHETLALFRLLRTVVDAFGYEALGSNIISMTHQPSDVLAVIWLWNHADAIGGIDREPADPIAIVPLFETIQDLKLASQILGSLLETPAYRELLKRQGNRQTVMLGYSDSTKDGGYLAACWSLYECQRELQELADEAGIDLVFFHGRGGSLGRGGGPAARSILSLPRKAFRGAIRLTEQGEVLADRYDDPNIAHRHLEQLVWSSLLASGTDEDDTPQAWTETMQRLAKESFVAYRQLVEQPGFVEFFRSATPISELEQLPIGSRPARRRGGNSMTDLRAIPWVFSWTQSRYLLPAWYGIGSAFAEELNDQRSLNRLRTMYLEWPFFKATIDNAELALAKTDLGIAKCYAGLLQTAEATKISQMIGEEFARSKRAILDIVDNQELLDDIPWLKQSIHVRNWYIDPLNFIQVELLRRLQARSEYATGSSDVTESEQDELRHLARLTVNGIAAGMRTTG